MQSAFCSVMEKCNISREDGAKILAVTQRTTFVTTDFSHFVQPQTLLLEFRSLPTYLDALCV